MRLKCIAKSILSLLTARRKINFYFSSLSYFDSLLALAYSFGILLHLNIKVGRNGKKKFIECVKGKFGDRKIFLYGSARSALYNHLKCLDFEADLEVIVTGFTCEVVPNAIINSGLKPVYADIDPNTFCMCPKSLVECITSKSRVLIIQHTFGISAEISTLLNIADRHNLYVIEDCAVSLGSYYKGKLTGTFGDAAIFSFELSKTITACRGGMLFVNSNKNGGIEKQSTSYSKVPEQNLKYSSNILFQLGLSGILYRPVIYNIGQYIIAVIFKIGIFKKSTAEHEKQGIISNNYLLKLSNQQAVILRHQFKNLDNIKAHSNNISEYYFEHLSKISDLNIFLYSENKLNLTRYPILSKNRDDLIEKFNNKGIELGLWFTAPLSSHKINHLTFGYHSGNCSNAEKVAASICNLPTNIRIRKKDADNIIQLCN